jgi:hypothetical protein
MSLVYYLPLRKRGWPSPARRWIANPLVSDLGSSNLPPRAFTDFNIEKAEDGGWLGVGFPLSFSVFTRAYIPVPLMTIFFTNYWLSYSSGSSRASLK